MAHSGGIECIGYVEIVDPAASEEADFPADLQKPNYLFESPHEGQYRFGQGGS